jgi:plasmid stabilization system protein ParE
MARVVWTEPALTDLDAIADYIAIDNRAAAVALVERVYRHVGQLAEHPESGSRPVELGEATRYRQIVEPPCRVLYRFDGERVYVVHVLRAERLLRMGEVTRQPG